MKSLSIRLLTSLVASLVLGALLLAMWSQWAFRTQGPERFHQDAMRLLADQAEYRWRNGGPDGVRDHFRLLSQHLRGEFHWYDREGRDLLGSRNNPGLILRFRNEDDGLPAPPRKRGAMMPPPANGLAERQIRPTPPIRMPDGRIAFVTPSPSKLYYLVEFVQGPPFQVPFTLFGGVLAVLSLFGLLVSRQVARPIRVLRSVVERFGQGDMATRSSIVRNDEIGDLSRTFNRMADQIAGIVERERGLVRNVAHEVRGPLTRMSLLLERIRQGRDVPVTVERIDGEIAALSRIPDTLLHLSAVESGRAPLDPSEVNVRNLLENLSDRFEPTAARLGLTLATDTGNLPDATCLTTDVAILERSLENVLENALRHAPNGSSVEFKAETSGGTIVLSIRDYGKGVRESELDTIFRPFYRTDASRNRHTGGVGLGLAITRAGAEALGGSVRAEMAEPGLRVVFELPILGSAAE